MSSSKDGVEFIIGKLGPRRFRTRPAFGEYIVYADDKAVALICDDLLYVKDHPVTQSLSETCEKAPPYPGAKEHFLIEEGQLATLDDLPSMLLKLAAALPEPKPRAKKPRGKR